MQAFLCDQGKSEAIEELMRLLPAAPDVLICNAALGTATVEAYVKERQAQDLALLQVTVFSAQHPLPVTWSCWHCTSSAQQSATLAAFPNHCCTAQQSATLAAFPNHCCTGGGQLPSTHFLAACR